MGISRRSRSRHDGGGYPGSAADSTASGGDRAGSVPRSTTSEGLDKVTWERQRVVRGSRGRQENQYIRGGTRPRNNKIATSYSADAQLRFVTHHHQALLLSVGRVLLTLLITCRDHVHTPRAEVGQRYCVSLKYVPISERRMSSE